MCSNHEQLACKGGRRVLASMPDRLSSMVATSWGRWGLIWGGPASCTMRDMVVSARAWISFTVLLVPA